MEPKQFQHFFLYQWRHMPKKDIYVRDHHSLLAIIGGKEHDVAQWQSIHSWFGRSDQSHLVDPFSYFLFQPVLHNWCNKGHSMWDNAHKRSFAANQKEQSMKLQQQVSFLIIRICQMPYNRIIKCVVSKCWR